jgi:membrane-bound serine protease (ClpP class)
MSLIPANPDVALLLISAGALGIYLEFVRPGAILPGVLGSVFAIFGLAGFSHVDWRGAALLLFAFPVLALEAMHPTRGILTAVAAMLMPLGAAIMDTHIHPIAALLTMAPFALITSFLLTCAARARRNKRTFPERRDIL